MLRFGPKVMIPLQYKLTLYYTNMILVSVHVLVVSRYEIHVYGHIGVPWVSTFPRARNLGKKIFSSKSGINNHFTPFPAFSGEPTNRQHFSIALT
jgi:hypothetical protein